MSRQAEIKVQLLKFVEISYKHNKGVTTKLVTGGKRFKLAVDESGKVTLSGELGFTKFEVSKEMVEELGIKLKAVSVTFKTTRDGVLTYSGSVSFFGVISRNILIFVQVWVSCRFWWRALSFGPFGDLAGVVGLVSSGSETLPPPELATTSSVGHRLAIPARCRQQSRVGSSAWRRLEVRWCCPQSSPQRRRLAIVLRLLSSWWSKWQFWGVP